MLSGAQIRALIRWSRERYGQPFAWGRNDCTTLCLEAIDILSGTNVAAPRIGKWHSPLSAARYGRKVERLDTVLRNVGWSIVDYPSLGDIVIGRRKAWDFCQVCLGEFCISVWPEHGVGLGYTKDLPRDAVIWRAP